MKTFKCLFTVLLLVIFEVKGQSPRFSHFTGKDGLSQAHPYSILHDSFGYIWVGTQDGLNRFDGKEFKVFKNDPFDSATLTHNWVWSVQEDNNGDLWLGTYEGLCKYLRDEDKFVQYYHRAGDTSSISGNRPNYIIKDKRGRLWISSWRSGLNLYNEKTNSFRWFQNNPDDSTSISDNFVRTLFCDHLGNVWAGTWNGGLNKVIEDEKGIRFERFNGDGYAHGPSRIASIAEDKSGILWICSYDAGVVLFNPMTKKFSPANAYPKKDANKIICDRNGNMWIATGNGLYVYYVKSGTSKTFYHDPSNPSSISSNSIYFLMEDRNGIIWIDGNGIDLYDPRMESFEIYQNKSGDPTSLSENLVWSFCEDDEQNIWIGTEGQNVDVFNPTTKSFRRVMLKDKRGNVASQVYKMVYDEGRMWMASYKAGFIRHEKYSGKTKFYLGEHDSPLGKIASTNDLLMDKDKTLWIGTEYDGVLHYDPSTEKVIQYVHDSNDSKSIGSSLIESIHNDNLGNIWVSFSGGVSIFEKKTKSFTNYRYDRKNAAGLSDQLITSITQQNDSIFWLCTHSGLNRLNRNTGKFSHFFEKDGLANNTTYEMLEDSLGNYWISSNGGLSKFNPNAYTFKNYTSEDGLQSNEFNSNAALKSSTGEFYFGGVNGFNVFRPEEIKENASPLPLVIQGYKIFDKSYLPQKQIALQYFENYITFSFAALEFSSPEKIKYAYKLEGFDDDWVSAGNRREAHYTNLDPGRYIFNVKASNPDGHWTEPGAFVEVIIRPPFWKTWWFAVLTIGSLAGIVYIIHRYRLDQSLKVERLRNKIASDLHDEVGSSLSRISIYSDLLQNGTETLERKSYLTGIGELSREVVSTMSDIVWSIDNRHDSLGALIIRMKDFATEILQVRNIDLEFSTQGINEQTLLDPALKQNIYLIFKESIHNIVKHARAGHVNVQLVNENGEFKMVIKDDGCGIAQNGKQTGNGLRNMKRRAQTVGGEFEIKSHQGTTLILRRKSL